MSKADDMKEVDKKQVGGSHYKTGKIQHWDIVLANDIPYLDAQVLRYVMRHSSKGGKQDLEKAMHFLEKMMSHYYPEGEPSYAEVRMGMGMTEPSYTVPVEAKSYLCSNASDGLHKFSHVYKHGKDGRLKEVLKCDLCNEEQERKA